MLLANVIAATRACWANVDTTLTDRVASLENRNRECPTECETPIASLRWFRSATSKLLSSGAYSPPAFLARMTNRVIRSSTAFGGMASWEHGLEQGSAAMADVISGHTTDDSRIQPMRYINEFVIERDKDCIAMLLEIGCCEHVFGDIMDFCPDYLKRSAGLELSDVTLPLKKLKDALVKCKPKPAAYCHVHKKHCPLNKTDMHAAGSPCKDASVANREGLMHWGPNAMYFWMWIAIVRDKLFKVVTHENVPRFGRNEFDELLGDLYVVLYFVIRLPTLGHKLRRRRQIIICLLRAWLHPVLKDMGHEGCETRCGDSQVEAAVPLGRIFEAVFKRNAVYHWRDYMFANEEEIKSERVRASRRDCVQARHEESLKAGCSIGGTIDLEFGDLPDSFAIRMGVEERKRLGGYLDLAPDLACDLMQDPIGQYTASNRSDELPCITAHTGLVWAPVKQNTDEDRWFLAAELKQTMGWPITEEAVRVVGCKCLHSRGSVQSMMVQRRSYNSRLTQLGNSMPINLVGGVAMLLTLMLPIASFGEPVNFDAPQAALASTDAETQRARLLRALRDAKRRRTAQPPDINLW